MIVAARGRAVRIVLAVFLGLTVAGGAAGAALGAVAAATSHSDHDRHDDGHARLDPRTQR